MVSVAMATYNGSKYIKRQIESILVNLSPVDEIIVSDDGSTDDTIDIVHSFFDDRIKIIEGPHNGLVKNFANAIDKCSGDYIFLCDQDDYWYPNKVERVLKAFKEHNCILVEHNGRVIDDEQNVIYPDFFEYRRVRTGFYKNLMRNTYHGCLMAFKSELKDKLEPYPEKGCFHDQWIGLMAEKYGSCYFLNEFLMDYYRHPGNASSFKHHPFHKQLSDRLALLSHILKNSKR